MICFDVLAFTDIGGGTWLVDSLISWLEVHDKLSGWAQFFGSMLALAVTYFTAFAPIWRRNRQLRQAARRILANGYNAIESYYRISEQFMPFSMSIRVALSSMLDVANEIDRFPLFEVDNHGGQSLAPLMVAMAGNLRALGLFLEKMAVEIDGREATLEEQNNIREFVGERLAFTRRMLSDKEIKWPSRLN